LERARDVLGQRKSGHAGALDPLADGVLVICLGAATKLVESFMDQPKVYRATALLDVTSECFDLERPTTPVAVSEPPTERQVGAALSGFEGRIPQVPPTTSALKVAGRPAYELHRAGKAPVLPARMVEIYWMHLHAYAWPRVDFEIACGRGTYVRAVIRDLGARLGVGGCLTSLTRRAVGPLTVEESWTFERLREAPRETAVIPLERARALLGGAVVPARPQGR
jgi:tRNA pseudouridine55 synthase